MLIFILLFFSMKNGLDSYYKYLVEVFFRNTHIQYNLNGSNPDGSFTMDDSKSFQSPQNPSNSSRRQIFWDFFLILSWNCTLCVLVKIASLRQF